MSLLAWFALASSWYDVACDCVCCNMMNVLSAGGVSTYLVSCTIIIMLPIFTPKEHEASCVSSDYHYLQFPGAFTAVIRQQLATSGNN
jgi:hypothetical protein